MSNRDDLYFLRDCGDPPWPFSGPNPFVEHPSDAEAPEWLGKVKEALMPHLLPGADLGYLNDEGKVSAENAGVALGILYRLMRNYSEMASSEADTPRALLTITERVMSGADTADRSLLAENIARVRGIVGAALSEVSQNRPDEAPEFFEGFGRDASEPIIDPSTGSLWRRSDATPIHLLLLVYGKIAQRKLRTLGEFYLFLSHTQIDVHLGSFDRFRKICDRVDFSIGTKGSRGRRDINAIVASVEDGFIEANDRLDENIS